MAEGEHGERRGARADWTMPVLGEEGNPAPAGPTQDRLPDPAGAPAPRRRFGLLPVAVGSGLVGMLGLGALGVVGWSDMSAVSETAPVQVAPEPFTDEEPPAPGPADRDAGGPQARAATLPDPLSPAVVAVPSFEAPECRIDDLSLVNHGWDSWSGHTATTITATNTSEATCLVGGWPNLRLEQGGPMALSMEQVSKDPQGRPTPPPRLVMEPGHSASVTLTWNGYRASADSATPQRLTLRVGLDPERREVPLAERPAPFDVVDGATLEVGPWLPAK